MSLEKSKNFFSDNVHRDLANRISEKSGIQSTRELGKYLGMPVLHERINKDTFGEVLEKVASRLLGWKGRFLSLAGRMTLTKAVLSSMPVHTMSTIALPSSTLNGLDKISRSFMWGSDVEKKKQHLVAWDRVCLPKVDGGMGIRAAKPMNQALLGKVGWRIIHDRDSLWARILRHKYKVGDIQDSSWMTAKSTCSSTWRSVQMGIREVVLLGLRWVLGDGREAQLWTNKWLGDKPLVDIVTRELPMVEATAYARDLWNDGTGWDFSRIDPFVSNETRLQLMAVVLDSFTGAKDRLSWDESSDGVYTVRSAYSLLMRNSKPRPYMGSFFERVWKLVGPERVRLFLWLVIHQVIMTNVERQRRHLCSSGLCHVCKGGDETILHILRDSPAMEGIWTRLVPQRQRSSFFAKSLLDWVYENLGDDRIQGGSMWATLFAMATWWGWKWRCGNVFGVNGKCRDRVRFVRELAEEVTKAHKSAWGRVTGGVTVTRMIAWKPPAPDWFKVNMDGASRGNPGLATAGGVIRNEEGAWCGGFAVNLGICSHH